MAKAGRKRKLGKKRTQSGAIVKSERDPVETMESILGVAKWQREKLGATPENFDDKRWGHPLGRMRLWAIDAKNDAHGLSQSQYHAIEGYLARRARARAVMGFPPDSPASPGFGATPRGGNLVYDADQIYEARRDHDADKATLKQHPQYAMWVALLGALARCEGEHHFWKAHLGDVRSVANVLIHARRRGA